MLRILNYVHPFTLFMFMVQINRFYDGLYDFKCMLIKMQIFIYYEIIKLAYSTVLWAGMRQG